MKAATPGPILFPRLAAGACAAMVAVTCLCMVTPVVEQAPSPPPPSLHRIDISIDSAFLAELLLLPGDQDTGIEYPCSLWARFGTDTVEHTCGLRIHGGSSRAYPKLSFRVYFRGPDLESDCLFAGFPAYDGARNKYSSLVLNANAIDFSRMRNYLAMYMTAKFGGIAPRVAYTDLYFNGEFWGLYTVIERINDKTAFNICGHSNFDLLKSQNHNGNLSTTFDIEGDTSKPASGGFSVEAGDTQSVSRFVSWLESDSFSYEEMGTRCHMPSVFALLMTCMYAGDRDAPTKNFYFLFDRQKDVAMFIPWDADATFNRNWCGSLEVFENIGCKHNFNGLYRLLMQDPQWVADLARRFREACREGHLADSLLDRVDGIEKLIKPSMHADLAKWKDTVLYIMEIRAAKNIGCEVELDDDPADSLRIWKSDVDLIREFIITREQNLLPRIE